MTNEFALVLVQELSLFIIGWPTCRFQEQEIKQPLGLFVICLRCLEYVSFVVDIASPALSVACVARFVSFVALSPIRTVAPCALLRWWIIT